jgi:hypothetical protein
MGFKEIQDLNADTTISLGGVNKKTNKPNPTKVEGYYLGKRQVESKKAKSGYAYLYIFQTPKGNLGVWGKTDLDRKMTAAVPGTMIRITQSGMLSTPNGDMYKFKVEVDSENTIEVSESLDSTLADRAEEEQSYEDDVQEDSTEAYEDVASDNHVALSASERQAKVQALLKKRN